MWTAFPCGFLIGGTLIALNYWQNPGLGGVLALVLMFILGTPALVVPLRWSFPDEREEWLVTLKRWFFR